MPPASPIRGVFLGAAIGSLLMLSGWVVRDRYPISTPCRDSIRRIAPDDSGISCPYDGQSIVFIELDGRSAALCQCVRSALPRGGTVLL